MTKVRGLIFFSVTVFAVSALAKRPPATEPQPCCEMEKDPKPHRIDPDLIGDWTVKTDWACAGKELSHLQSAIDERQWTLISNGDCWDSLGNRCKWWADEGRFWLDFEKLGLRFRGTYKNNLKIEHLSIFTNSCEKGCVEAVHLNNTSSPAPAQPKKPDTYGLSLTSTVDQLLVGDLKNFPNCGGDRKILFLPDGVCMIAGVARCTWSAKGANIEIDMDRFRFRGTYDKNGVKNGTLQNTLQCGGNSCLPPATTLTYPSTSQNASGPPPVYSGNGGPTVAPVGPFINSAPPVVPTWCYQSCVSGQ